MEKRLFILFAMILPLSSYCQPHFPKTGIKAPPIKVDEWVNKGITEKDLKGKTIVLEFWFIHCAPCVAAIPHLNKVAEKYKNDPLAFLAITFDKKEAVKEFLTKMYMASSVGTDTSQSTINAFDVSMFPSTIIIDTNGIIAWTGYPFDLENVLDTMIKTNATILSKKRNPETGQQSPAYQLDVKVHNLDMGGSNFTQHGKGEIIILNRTIKQIISQQMNVSEMRIDTVGKYFDKPLDINLKADDKSTSVENNEEVLLLLLQKQLNIQIKETKKDANIWTMRLKNDSLISQYKSNQKESGTSSNAKEWKGNNIAISGLIKVLEDKFEILIDNGAPLKDGYNFKIPLGNFEEVVKVLENTYGFELYQMQRKTDFVTVDFTRMKEPGK